MYRLFIALILALLIVSPSLYAKQAASGEDLKGVCELAGGTWTGQESGNWACCWDDWGCYGCHSGICKMQCRTQRCRDANRIKKPSPGTKSIKGLTSPYQKAPIVPIKK